MTAADKINQGYTWYVNAKGKHKLHRASVYQGKYVTLSNGMGTNPDNCTRPTDEEVAAHKAKQQ